MDKVLSTIKPDLIISWPTHTDYPLFRKFIYENRDRFSRVIVIWTDMQTGLEDYRHFITEIMAKDRINFIDNDPVAGDQDWRNIAVNKAVNFSNNEWIWFTEQDFFPTEIFWRVVDQLKDIYDVFGAVAGLRLHPCSIFIKRKLLDQTSKNFGVITDTLDHFGVLQQELENQQVPIGIIPDNTYYHMNGLSQNMYFLQIGEEPNYNKEEFEEYCKKCLELTDLHPDFEELFNWYLEK